MFGGQSEGTGAANPLVDTAWSILEAANEVSDNDTVDACRRVIDASYSGAEPSAADVNIVMGFFN